MHVVLRLTLWNLGFACVFLAIEFIFAVWVEHYFPGVGRGVADVLAFGLPGLLALWVLFLGLIYAGSRTAVVACAVCAGVLTLVQGALLAFLVAWSKGIGGRTNFTTALEVLLTFVLVVGAILIWSFVRAKRAPSAKSA
jgi:hypothetical protein